MYAVIRAGGKQFKVAEGDVIEVERAGDDGAKLEFTPLLVVDDDGTTHAAKDALAKAKVTGQVVGETKGPKVTIFRYKNKTRYRRRTGHRQKYSSVEISGIKLGGRASSRTKEKVDGT
ncbi:MAG TPA: 50S ribosomal protein L21 [Actinomycetota bacterium]|nr:50S ribosomal protein L21 [Actinomycetota bacterium]